MALGIKLMGKIIMHIFNTFFREKVNKSFCLKYASYLIHDIFMTVFQMKILLNFIVKIVIKINVLSLMHF